MSKKRDRYEITTAANAGGDWLCSSFFLVCVCVFQQSVVRVVSREDIHEAKEVPTDGKKPLACRKVLRMFVASLPQPTFCGVCFLGWLLLRWCVLFEKNNARKKK